MEDHWLHPIPNKSSREPDTRYEKYREIIVKYLHAPKDVDMDWYNFGKSSDEGYKIDRPNTVFVYQHANQGGAYWRVWYLKNNKIYEWVPVPVGYYFRPEWIKIEIRPYVWVFIRKSSEKELLPMLEKERKRSRDPFRTLKVTWSKPMADFLKIIPYQTSYSGSEVVHAIKIYAKSKKLLNPENPNEIFLDEELEDLLTRKEKINVIDLPYAIKGFMSIW